MPKGLITCLMGLLSHQSPRSMTRLTVAIAVLVSAGFGKTEQQTQFRGRVDVVSLNISVLSGNKPVLDLKATDFLVTDNGIRQSVSNVSRENRAH